MLGPAASQGNERELKSKSRPSASRSAGELPSTPQSTPNSCAPGISNSGTSRSETCGSCCPLAGTASRTPSDCAAARKIMKQSFDAVVSLIIGTIIFFMNCFLLLLLKVGQRIFCRGFNLIGRGIGRLCDIDIKLLRKDPSVESFRARLRVLRAEDF